jgi:hypothetical protein
MVRFEFVVALKRNYKLSGISFSQKYPFLDYPNRIEIHLMKMLRKLRQEIEFV